MPSVSSIALPADVAHYFVEYTREKYDVEDTEVASLTAPADVHAEIEGVIDDSDVVGYSDEVSQITAPSDVYVDESGRLDYDALVQDVVEAVAYGERQERSTEEEAENSLLSGGERVSKGRQRKQ